MTAREALNLELFNPKTRLFGTQDNILSSLTNLLHSDSFDSEDIKPLNPIKRSVLYYVVHRVIPEDKFSFFKDIFRHVEKICSTKHDGLIH